MICRQCHLKPATKRGTFCSRPCQFAYVQAQQAGRRPQLAQWAREARAKQTPERRSELASRARRIGAYQQRMRKIGDEVRKLPRALTREALVKFGWACYERGKNAERMRHAQKKEKAA